MYVSREARPHDIVSDAVKLATFCVVEKTVVITTQSIVRLATRFVGYRAKSSACTLLNVYR